MGGKLPWLRCMALAGGLLIQVGGGILLALAKESRDAVVAQILIGLGSGPLYPLGYSIISCYYEAKDCGTPNGVFSQTAYFGPALASLSVIIARNYGWRLAAMIICAALFVAICALLTIVFSSSNIYLKEVEGTNLIDTSPDIDDDTHDTDEEDEAFFRSNKQKNNPTKPSTISEDFSTPDGRALAICLCLALGGGARYAAGYAVPSYIPYYFEIEYASRSELFSTANAVAIFACGSTSALVGGALAQMLARRNVQYTNKKSPTVFSYATIPIISCLLGGICTLFIFQKKNNFFAAVVALFAMQLFGEAWLAGIVAAFRSVPKLGRYVDAALGIFYTTATMLGCLNLLFLGQAIDNAHTSYRLRFTMAAAIAIPYFFAALFFFLAAKIAAMPKKGEKRTDVSFSWCADTTCGDFANRYLSYHNYSYPPPTKTNYQPHAPFLPPKGDPPLIDGYPANAASDQPQQHQPTDTTPLLGASNIGFFPCADDDDNDNPTFRARSSFLLRSPGSSNNPFLS
eukprot:CAMPEP_0197309840 /NCGR_PEP_ID=MMETSP0891-20130614/8457_1 /TAXON_ID=44058 ORGANISM="Aureoumbra lagunensis, Strain CCMP1510" /NCGR_SAMPLE_ID=MMETSP0891 /ASSEMBLY_ACC=CAM_ASM_000534 /LENGTH=514 /DNA_ID=CAMNT_0042795177 /DNA_START=178 /DNA_END=1722 /DNA_ORIENTATION=+